MSCNSLPCSPNSCWSSASCYTSAVDGSKICENTPLLSFFSFLLLLQLSMGNHLSYPYDPYWAYEMDPSYYGYDPDYMVCSLCLGILTVPLSLRLPLRADHVTCLCLTVAITKSRTICKQVLLSIPVHDCANNVQQLLRLLPIIFILPAISNNALLRWSSSIPAAILSSCLFVVYSFVCMLASFPCLYVHTKIWLDK